MKEKIIVFVIGVLVGAVLATGAFFIYNKLNPTNNSVTTNQTQNLPGGNAPEMNGEKPSKKSNSESTNKTNSQKSNSNTSTESN